MAPTDQLAIVPDDQQLYPAAALPPVLDWDAGRSIGAGLHNRGNTCYMNGGGPATRAAAAAAAVARGGGGGAWPW